MGDNRYLAKAARQLKQAAKTGNLEGVLLREVSSSDPETDPYLVATFEQQERSEVVDEITQLVNDVEMLTFDGWDEDNRAYFL